MTNPIPVVLVVEDVLSEVVLKKILHRFPGKYEVLSTLGREGYGFIKKNMPAFNLGAAETPFFVLTDLDQNSCPIALLREWLPRPRHPNLVFRVATREVEAWLLADPPGLARFLGISRRRIPGAVETLDDPKATLLDLARESPNKELREALVPAPGRRARVGPDYNGRLFRFVTRHWSIDRARRQCESLRRAVLACENFQRV